MLDDRDFHFRHPFAGFFLDEEFTEPRFNGPWLIFATAAIIESVRTQSWAYLVVGLLMLVWLWRCYRRYKLRLNYFIATRDRNDT